MNSIWEKKVCNGEETGSKILADLVVFFTPEYGQMIFGIPFVCLYVWMRACSCLTSV
jgi:hypothetical protein